MVLLPSKTWPSLIVSPIISALTHHAAYIDTLIWLKTWLYSMRPLMANPDAITSMAHTRPPLKNKASSELPTHHGLVTVPLSSAALPRYMVSCQGPCRFLCSNFISPHYDADPDDCRRVAIITRLCFMYAHVSSVAVVTRVQIKSLAVVEIA